MRVGRGAAGWVASGLLTLALKGRAFSPRSPKQGKNSPLPVAYCRLCDYWELFPPAK